MVHYHYILVYIGEEFAGEDNMKQLVSEYIKEVACTPQKLYPHFYFAMAVACVRFAAIFLVSTSAFNAVGMCN